MNFDLNINNYTKNELIEMFELPSTFDKNIFEIKESKLRESIINNREINSETQKKTLNFLIQAKQIILNDPHPSASHKNLFETKIEEFYNSSYELKPSQLENKDEHMVQIRKDKPYLSSFPSEFFPGVINPIKKRTVKKNLNIDSRFRENYFNSVSTNFNFTLPTNFNDVIQMQLSAIELPTTYYVVSKQFGNNFFNITVNTLTTVINIPDGNYDQNTIMDAINNQLLLAGTPFNKINFIVNLTNKTTGSCQTLVGFLNDVDLSNSTFELNFQADKTGIDDRNTPLPLKFGWILGFRNGIYVNNLNYVSEGVVDISGPKYLFLVVDDYNNNVNNNFYSAFNSSILNKNILARVSLQSNAFSNFEQNNLNIITTPREYFGPVNIQTINIQLLDEYGRIVDLNNMDFSFCVTLTTVYDL
jgi:hypothetical protein